jgi:hypothetical protein
VASLADANAILEAQRAELGGDEALRREAAPWRDASPAECFEAVIALCRDTDHYLAMLSAEQLERALAPVPLPADALELLRARRAGGR